MEPENYRLNNARYISDYNIALEFQDGTKGTINLENDLNVGVLKELRDKELFSQFQIHPIFKTLAWPNGADIAPEFLRENLQ